MKNIKDLRLMDVALLLAELLEANKKKLTLRFAKNPEAKKYRKQVARIKTVINSK